MSVREADNNKVGNLEISDLIARSTPRKINFTVNVNPYAHGSVIVEFGTTKVYTTAFVSEEVPPFLKGKGCGWVTAEYAMLPCSTHDRIRRERNKISGRSQEIQRLIGRSLRACVDTTLLGERTITVDCDVLIADGGTRTASITGGYVALVIAANNLLKKGILTKSPIIQQVAAVSVGIKAELPSESPSPSISSSLFCSNSEGKVYADLDYQEDSSFETDMNLVMTADGNIVEIQGTAEKKPFSERQLSAMLVCGRKALEIIFQRQDQALATALEVHG